MLLASVLTYFLVRNEEPVLDAVQARFVAPGPEAAGGALGSPTRSGSSS